MVRPSTFVLLAILSGTIVAQAAAVPDSDLRGPLPLNSRQRTEAVQQYITRATECVAQWVAKDPRVSDPKKLGEAIVDSMPDCAALLRSMIDTYDQYFGNGTGEAFFSGPYLDVLPAAVKKWVAATEQ